MTKVTGILDALPSHPSGLVEQPESPERHGREALGANARIVSAKEIGVVAMPLSVVAAHHLFGRLLHRGEIAIPLQSRNSRVKGLKQQVGIVKLAGDRHQFV